MANTRLSLVHEVLAPERRAGSGKPALIMLHGRGADERDLLALAANFDRRLLTISVRAPYVLGPGYHWYEFAADRRAGASELLAKRADSP